MSNKDRKTEYSIRVSFELLGLAVFYLLFNERIPDPIWRVITGLVLLIAIVLTTSFRRVSYVKEPQGGISDVTITDYYLARLIRR